MLDPLLPGGPRAWTLHLELWPVLTGILVGVLAEVFVRGARLREDVEGLVSCPLRTRTASSATSTCCSNGRG